MLDNGQHCGAVRFRKHVPVLDHALQIGVEGAGSVQVCAGICAKLILRLSQLVVTTAGYVSAFESLLRYLQILT